MLPRLTAPQHHHRSNEDYYSKPAPPDEKIPENFRKNITRLDESGSAFHELSKDLIYDYILYVFCQFITNQDSERRPILDGGYALNYYLTNPLKEVFGQYTRNHRAASCTPTPGKTDIDLLDRYYSSFGENAEKAFITELADCIRYGMGIYCDAIAAFCSDVVDIHEYESYQEVFKRQERVTIKRHLKSRSLSICMFHPSLTIPQGTSPLLKENHIIRVDLNFASNHLKPYHCQSVKIGRHPTLIPVRVLDDIIFNHCHTLIYHFPGDKVRDKFLERITVFHHLTRIDPKLKLEERTIKLIDWTMNLLQSDTRQDETILSIEETSRSFNYETVPGFKHSAAIAEHELAQRSPEPETVQEDKTIQIQEASRKKETRYDLEDKTTLFMVHEKEALFEIEVLHEIPPVPEQVTVEATIHEEPAKPTVSEAASVKLEELTPLIVQATDEVAVACKLDVAPETPASTPVSQLTPSISPVASETTQISDSDLSLDVPEKDSGKKQKTAMSKHQLKKQRQRKSGKQRNKKPQVKQTPHLTAPETEGIPSRERAEARLLSDSGTTADPIQQSPIMTPESKFDTGHQVELLAKKDTTTKTSEQLKSVTSEPEATPSTAVRPKKMIQHEKDPQTLLELIDKTANNIQSFRDNWSTLRPHEKMGLLTTLQNVELYTDELFAACEKGLLTKKPRKWKERLQRLLEQSHSLLDNITQLKSDISKGPAYRSEHEIRVQDIEKTKSSLTRLISQIEPLAQPSIAPTAKQEASKKTDTEQPTHTLDDDLQQIDVILKQKEEELKTIKLTQTTAMNIDEALLEIHQSPDEIIQLEQTFKRCMTKKRGKFTERIGKIVHLLSLAYKIHASQEYDMTESCHAPLHRLEMKAERNQVFSRLWLIYSQVEQLQSQFPQIIHHLSDIKELFTDDTFKHACKITYDLTKEACQLKKTEAEKLANILQKTLDTYILIFEPRINHDIERVIYLADLLHQTMKTLENTTLHRSDWYLEIYQKHLSYIIDLPNYCEVCFHNKYINSSCDQTIFALENLAEKIGIEKLTDILNKTCNALYKRGFTFFTSQIIIWQLYKKIQRPDIKILLLENTQELYVKLKWDQTKHGTQFMVDHKEPCEFMLMQAETKLALGNAMKMFMVRNNNFSFWKDELTLESDQCSQEFWIQRFNQFQPEAHIAQIRNHLSTLNNQKSELTKVFDFSESRINEELSAQSVHDTLDKLAVEKTLTLLHDTYGKIKPAELLQQKYRNPSLETASVLVIHSEVLQGIGEQISPDYSTHHEQTKVHHLQAAITAYKQALFIELFYYKIFKKHFSEQFIEFHKDTYVPKPNPSRVLSLWQALSRTLLELERIGADSSIESCRLVEDTFRDYHEELFQLATQQPGFVNENLDFLQHRVRCLSIAGHDQASLSTLKILLSVLPKHPDGVKSLEGHSNPLPLGFLDRQFDQCRRYMKKRLQAVEVQHLDVLENAKALVEFTQEFTETLKAHDVLTQDSSCPVRLQAQTAAACIKELADTRNVCLEYQPHLAELEEIQQELQTAHARTLKTFPTDIKDMTINIQQFSVDDILNMLNESLDNITVFEKVFFRIININSQQPTHPLPLRIIQGNLLSLSQCTQDYHKNYTCLHEHLCQTFQYTEFKEDSGEKIVNLTGMIQRLGNLSFKIHNAIFKKSEVTKDILYNHSIPLRECFYNITTFSNTAEWLKTLLCMPSKTAKNTQYILVIKPLKDHSKFIKELIDKDTRLSKTSAQRVPRFLLNTIHIFTHQLPDLSIACDALSSYLTCFRSGKPFFDDERNHPTHEELIDTFQSIAKAIKEKQKSCQKKILNKQEFSDQKTLQQIVESFASSIVMCDSIAKDSNFEHINFFSRLVPASALKNLRTFQEDLHRRSLHYHATLRAQNRVTQNQLFSAGSAPDSTDN